MNQELVRVRAFVSTIPARAGDVWQRFRQIVREEIRAEADRQSFKFPSPWLTIDAAAEYLGMSRASFNELRAERKRAKAADKDSVFVADHRRNGGVQPRFHREELDAWMKAQRQ